ncbi:MAG: adenylyl-sulfate kinase [Thermomicrobiales bacterium]|nr:MAG: adenylyl-sulfate kinase [Thermomicrobiales bacterium]
MKALTIWLTGLPCAGKTTLANLLCRSLLDQGMTNVEVLDGDVVRTHLSKGLGFSRADRDTNIRRIGWVCRVLTKHGVCSIVAAVSPFRAARDDVRTMVEQVGGPGSFLEVWVRCGVEECIRRDVKGMYAKALRGEIEQFTGVSDPYEEPLKADVVVNTGAETPSESVRRILEVVHRAAASR